MRQLFAPQDDGIEPTSFDARVTEPLNTGYSSATIQCCNDESSDSQLTISIFDAIMQITDYPLVLMLTAKEEKAIEVYKRRAELSI